MSLQLKRRLARPLPKLAFAAVAFLAAGSCVVRGQISTETARLQITVLQEDGSPLPPADQPMPLSLGGMKRFQVVIDAMMRDGSIDTRFNGYVRVSVQPGGVSEILGADVVGRNVLLRNGHADSHMISVVGGYGDTRVWAEDMGYMPADPTKPPQCSNGLDDNGNGLIDYPADPGCAFANDDTEDGGSYAAGVSPAIHFQLPTLAQVQGYQCPAVGDPACAVGSSGTPFENEQVEVNDGNGVAPGEGPTLIVTRVSADGFFATDVDKTRPPEAQGKYNHIYAFNFNIPPGMRVCDRLTYLSGTMSEFFGFTEIGFPSYKLHQWRLPVPGGDPGDGECLVPDPNLITDTMLGSSDAATVALEPWESSLVRVQNVTIGKHFGPDKASNNVFTDNSSNCDLNDDGKVDFDTPGNPEMACSNACAADRECVDWSGYASRGNFRVVVGASTLGILINVGSVPGFDPLLEKGRTIKSVTGTVRHFSGGPLNWTIECRCADDFLYCKPGDTECENNAQPKSTKESCVLPRTEYDPNEGTN
ncbi:MAG: hypothetical protein HY898_25785 [Deltaproteobacteria bacterium]|nr:hypothetical protein [Deltaproteobacteria bacterium]